MLPKGHFSNTPHSQSTFTASDEFFRFFDRMAIPGWRTYVVAEFTIKLLEEAKRRGISPLDEPSVNEAALIKLMSEMNFTCDGRATPTPPASVHVAVAIEPVKPIESSKPVVPPITSPPVPATADGKRLTPRQLKTK